MEKETGRWERVRADGMGQRKGRTDIYEIAYPWVTRGDRSIWKEGERATVAPPSGSQGEKILWRVILGTRWGPKGTVTLLGRWRR